MSRQDRKNRTDIIFKGCGGLTDAFDDVIKQAWWINDDEYDYISEFATGEEIELFLGGKCFSDKKKALLVVDNILIKMYNNIN